MIFAWDEQNREHIAKHAVSEEEAEQVVEGASAPYPAEIGDDKLIVWGPADNGRLLQVIYVFKGADEVSFESIAADDWPTIEAGTDAQIVRVIHAMDLTPAMKKRYRRRRR
jgi:uncharacterized DUF497 family protein